MSLHLHTTAAHPRLANFADSSSCSQHSWQASSRADAEVPFKTLAADVCMQEFDRCLCFIPMRIRWCASYEDPVILCLLEAEQ